MFSPWRWPQMLTGHKSPVSTHSLLVTHSTYSWQLYVTCLLLVSCYMPTAGCFTVHAYCWQLHVTCLLLVASRYMPTSRYTYRLPIRMRPEEQIGPEGLPQFDLIRDSMIYHSVLPGQFPSAGVAGKWPTIALVVLVVVVVGWWGGGKAGRVEPHTFTCNPHFGYIVVNRFGIICNFLEKSGIFLPHYMSKVELVTIRLPLGCLWVFLIQSPLICYLNVSICKKKKLYQ